MNPVRLTIGFCAACLFVHSTANWRQDDAERKASLEQAKVSVENAKKSFTGSDYVGAVRGFEEAVRLYESWSPGSLELAQCYNSLAKITDLVGDLNNAAAWGQKALAILSIMAPDSMDLATTYNNLGNVAEDRGELRVAEDWYKKNLAITSVKAPGTLPVAITLNNLGNIARTRGELTEAERWYERVVAIVSAKSPDSLDLAAVLDNLGNVALNRGDFAAALSWYKKDLAISSVKAPNSLGLAQTYNNLGVVMSSQGNSLEAESWHEKAFAIKSVLAPNSLTLASTLTNLGVLASDRGDLLLAMDRFKKALAIRSTKAPNSLELAVTLSNIGEVTQRRGDLTAARAWFTKALAIRSVKGPNYLELAQTYIRLGQVDSAQKRFVQARDEFNLASSLVEGQRSKLLSPDSRSMLANQNSFVVEHFDCLVHLGDDAEAVRLLESSKSRGVAEALSNREIRFDTPKIRIIDNELDRAYAALGNEDSEARRSSFRNQISGLLVEKRQAELSFRQSDPKLASLAYPHPLNLQDVQKTIGPETLVLHFSIGPDYSYCVVISSPEKLPAQGGHIAGVRVFRINTNEKDLVADVSAFSKADSIPMRDSRGRVVDAGSPLGAKDIGLRLYSELIEPIAPLLKGHGFARLVICPHDILNTFPFAALPTGKGKYLADVLPITTVPSITTLQQIRSMNREMAKVPLLALGDPAYHRALDNKQNTNDRATRAATRGLALSRLPNTRFEVEAISALYGVKPLLGSDATVSSLKRLAGNARIVHLACHGLLDPIEPMASSLALTPEEGGDGLLEAYEVIRDIHLNADLVVLSACQTGLGKTEGNEGINGMTRAFEYAGAKSVLVSLWSVDDKSTSDFMKLFYRAMKKGEPKDLALQYAENQQRKKYPSPHDWAGFTLCGDWK